MATLGVNADQPMSLRRCDPLISDDPSLPRSDRAAAYSDRERIAALFGTAKPVVEAVFAHEPAWVLDVGCGSGDLSRAILREARRRARRVEIVALDRDQAILDYARDRTGPEPLMRYVRSEFDALPFPDRSFDLVVCGDALHRLDSGLAVDMLRELRRVARLTPFVLDQRRTTLGTLLSYVESRFVARSRAGGRDALAVARRAYSAGEAMDLCRLAAWNSPVVTHRPYSRMILSDARA